MGAEYQQYELKGTKKALETMWKTRVEDAINERHSELLQETIDLKRENKKLLLKLENKRVMEDAYETGQV